MITEVFPYLTSSFFAPSISISNRRRKLRTSRSSMTNEDRGKKDIVVVLFMPMHSS